jgi:hypothetical protein
VTPNESTDVPFDIFIRDSCTRFDFANGTDEETDGGRIARKHSFLPSESGGASAPMDEDVAEEFLKVESFAAVGLAKHCPR